MSTLKPIIWTLVTGGMAAFGALGLSACSPSDARALRRQVDSLQAVLAEVQQERATVAERLARFDTLDFDVYSNQKWDRLGESHADSIIVNWPDGRQAVGLAQHVADLKPQFVFAPDTRIAEHPVRVGEGDWTCVTGVMTGTFSHPMPIGNGRTIAPTNKAFRLPMVTIGHWRGDKMIEESLFWDNQAFMRQVGLAK